MSSVSIDSNKLKSLFGAYYDRRMIRILLLGIISGFPWVLIASALSLWLKEEGLSRSTIGWAGLIFGVYAFNFLWAPIIDRLRLPFLTNKMGHRKSIIIMMQTVILICLVIWSVLEPTQNLALIIGVGLAIAISSATQDITIDALRIEQIKRDETSSMAAGAAMAAASYSLDQAATEIANTISAGVSVDLDAAAQGLGHDSFAAAVEAYNEQYGTSYTVDSAKEALGQ